MHVKSLRELRNHTTYYHVCKPTTGAMPWITKMRIISYPYFHGGLYLVDSYFVHVLILGSSGYVYLDTRSLCDMNIPENSYGNNRLFHTYDQAIQFMNS